jgi:hypothetical protein
MAAWRSLLVAGLTFVILAPPATQGATHCANLMPGLSLMKVGYDINVFDPYNHQFEGKSLRILDFTYDEQKEQQVGVSTNIWRLQRSFVFISTFVSHVLLLFVMDLSFLSGCMHVRVYVVP